MAVPVVVNRHHYKSKEELPSPWVYIGRGTPLGNPFLLRDHGEERCLERYRKWLWDKLSQYDEQVLDELRQITPAHHLVCSCAPRPCHGDVVVKAWEWCVKRGLVQPESYEEAERAAMQDPQFH